MNVYDEIVLLRRLVDELRAKSIALEQKVQAGGMEGDQEGPAIDKYFSDGGPT